MSAELTNKEISKVFKLAAQLMELHDANPYKLRSIQNASFKIERMEQQLATVPAEELEALDGIGKSTAAKIISILDNGSFDELDEWLEKTPEGILQILAIKGIGPKKVKVIWKDLGVENPGELLYACNENRLIELKGFGEKTQEQIKKALEYAKNNQGKFRYADVEEFAEKFLQDLKDKNFCQAVAITGSYRRRMEILDKIEILVAANDHIPVIAFFGSHPQILTRLDHLNNGSLHFKAEIGIEIVLISCKPHDFHLKLFETTGSDSHISELTIPDQKFESEEAIYAALKMQFVPPELREGSWEINAAKENKIPKLLELSDLKGILHNHSTYSDGAHTLKQMAEHCKSLGYEYFCICDHSKSAFYANGMQPDRILAQHNEIDKLNDSLAPFKIFKGIESDILFDGSLDYPDEILASFDMVVASIHSVLRMDLEKATSRLIKAIENPYTTILGHPTGRLLLAREAYPIDHKKVIDACAANGVILELNANPYRLDIDWRWIHYALEKDVKISINPDAHHMDGFKDMHFGVLVARKGGLTAEMTFNAMSLSEMKDHLVKRKAAIKS